MRSIIETCLLCFVAFVGAGEPAGNIGGKINNIIFNNSKNSTVDETQNDYSRVPLGLYFKASLHAKSLL